MDKEKYICKNCGKEYVEKRFFDAHVASNKCIDVDNEKKSDIINVKEQPEPKVEENHVKTNENSKQISLAEQVDKMFDRDPKSVSSQSIEQQIKAGKHLHVKRNILAVELKDKSYEVRYARPNTVGRYKQELIWSPLRNEDLASSDFDPQVYGGFVEDPKAIVTRNEMVGFKAKKVHLAKIRENETKGRLTPNSILEESQRKFSNNAADDNKIEVTKF